MLCRGRHCGKSVALRVWRVHRGWLRGRTVNAGWSLTRRVGADVGGVSCAISGIGYYARHETHRCAMLRHLAVLFISRWSRQRACEHPLSSADRRALLTRSNGRGHDIYGFGLAAQRPGGAQVTDMEMVASRHAARSSPLRLESRQHRANFSFAGRVVALTAARIAWRWHAAGAAFDPRYPQTT